MFSNVLRVALTAKSFVLDLLSTLRGGTMPVRTLVTAGVLFGIAENSIRVSLARLLAAGQVQRDERGQYGLGQQAEAVRRHVTSWRTVEERIVAWNGGWIGVHRSTHAPRLSPKAAQRRQRALHFLGFRSLVPGFEIRPDNLRGGIAEVRTELHGLGLEGDAMVFEVRNLDTAADARARNLWNVAELRTGYQRSLRALVQSERHLQQLPHREAMTESFLLGGKVIRQLVLDPRLPEPIVSAAERRALIDAMRRYDRLGRGCWATFLREFGVPHVHTPADTRMAHGAEKLAAHAMGGATS